MVLPLAMSLAMTDFDKRTQDWRNGAIVYQIFVDRFVAPADRKAKAKFFTSPKTYKEWSETPKGGHLLPELGVWSHELDFWGGDLKGVTSKLDYIKGLGAEIVYLNPIHEAFTNHKYDATDYLKVDPAFGTEADLKGLITDSHKRKLKVVLDGVFNHMGRHSPHLAKALTDPKSKQRDWFYTGKQYKAGYRAWLGGINLPILNLDSPSLQEYIWKGKDSVVKKFLDLGIDGWRMDVAYEIGHDHLAEMRKAAHKAKPGSLVFGEIWGYPEGWFGSVDGQHNMLATDLAREMMNGAISGGQVGRIWNDLVTDAGIENLLKCWIVADNHDTPRLPSQLPKFEDRQLMIALMMTLPGCPNVYYGSELGMQGGGDPENRAPMRWDLNTADNPTLAWTKKMIGIRSKLRALRYGDFNALQTEQLFAFTRTSGYLKDSVVVVVNPTSKPITETFAHRIGKLMSWQQMKDSLSSETVFQKSGLMTVTVPPKSIRVLTPVMTRTNGFSPTDRIK